MVEPKMLNHYETDSAPALFLAEDGMSGDLHFLALDGTPIVVSMHRKILETLRGNIAAELDKPIPPIGGE